MNFTAIDFETANEKRSSPCSVGITVVENGQITGEHYFLIRPKEMRFVPMNIMIHGITPDQVEDADEFDIVFEKIRPYLENRLVIAHNASFDMSVLRNTLDLYQIPYPSFDYCCTMVMARHFYPYLENAKLNTVNAHLGYSFSHHQALADASACANVLLEIARELGTNDIKEIAKATGIGIGHVYPGGYTAAKSGGKSQVSCRKDRPLTFSPSAPFAASTPLSSSESISRAVPYNDLTGKRIVLTGPLKSMTRGEAIGYITDHGGTYLSSVSKKTNMLVTNVPNIDRLRPEQMSTKLRKAMSLISSGLPIQILTEDEFLRGGH
ncbi:MAG: DNA polymerase III subunit epsilon [Lachnospiraceae bacterium]|nr:DNA polymerase III subunit epsilon [Lachnospiraceae bacterium]